jgi:hypothetical protein
LICASIQTHTGYLTSPSRRDPLQKIYIKRRRDSRKDKGGFSILGFTRIPGEKRRGGGGQFQKCNFDSADHSVMCEIGVPLPIWGVGAWGVGTRVNA